MNKMRSGSFTLQSLWKKTKATRRLFSAESDLYLSAKVDVIAHRGASGYMPDHTLPTYKSAFESGSDWIELDAHCTKDGVLVVNHDIELHETTDVADWEWAAPLRTRTKAPAMDGELSTMIGWMISDFSLEQIKRLRVKMRDDSRDRDHDLLFEIPTVEETANFVQSLVDNVHVNSHNDEYTREEWLEARNQFTLKHGFARANTNVGLYIETKRASYYRNLGLPLEENLVDVLENSTFKGPIIIQSFELDSLKLIRHLKPEWKTVKLLTRPELDHHTNNGTLSPFMESLSQHCDGIGPNKLSIIPNPKEPPKKSDAIDAAHAHDMFVHPYTFRSDVRHLHRVYGGNATQEFAEFFNLGVDGVFCDFPDHGVYARESCNLLRSQGVEYSSFYRVTE
mmetsp:Transcript_5915/g.10808  ORF Transcript_5915/g.10808 Transcript_5915/m.10808 type:complete len:395 (+) Transcript_5915:36-1220(+)